MQILNDSIPHCYRWFIVENVKIMTIVTKMREEGNSREHRGHREHYGKKIKI